MLRRDAGADTPVELLIQHVLVDRDAGAYPGGLDVAEIEALGVPVLSAPLVDPARPGRVDGHRLTEALISMT